MPTGYNLTRDCSGWGIVLDTFATAMAGLATHASNSGALLFTHSCKSTFL